MAREQRQKTEKKKDSRRKVSLADALTATQQHTVPVLPSFGPSSRTTTAGTPSQTTETSATSTQATQTLENKKSPGDKTAKTAQVRTLATGQQKITGAQPRMNAATPGELAMGEPGMPGMREASRSLSQSMIKAQLVLPDVMADAVPAGKDGKATRVLPAMDETEAATTQLVPVRSRDRQLALPSASQSQAIFIRGAKRPPRFNSARVVPRRQGPRPFIVQFIVAMATVMLLFSAFTVSSPLGKTLAAFGPLQAYANSVPWVPTATPTPRPTATPVYYAPTGSGPGTQAIINEIVAVFGGYSQGALNVARCESGYDPYARNPYAIGNSHAEGVFQILYPSTWDGTSYAGYSPYDANANIHAAYQIFSRDGYSWREWACQP